MLLVSKCDKNQLTILFMGIATQGYFAPYSFYRNLASRGRNVISPRYSKGETNGIEIMRKRSGFSYKRIISRLCYETNRYWSWFMHRIALISS